MKSVIHSGFNEMIKENAKEITDMDIAITGQQIWITENHNVIQEKNKRINNLLNVILLHAGKQRHSNSKSKKYCPVSIKLPEFKTGIDT